MKKITFSLILSTIFFVATTKSFSQSFVKETKTINLGLGYGYGLGVLGSAEVGVTDDISAGVVAGFSRRSYGYFGNNYGVTYLVVGARGSYHFGRLLTESGVNMDKLDPYAGLTAGFRSVKSGDYNGYSGVDTGVMFGGYIGIRYQFNDKLGFMAEGGSPFSTVGITFKL